MCGLKLKDSLSCVEQRWDWKSGHRWCVLQEKMTLVVWEEENFDHEVENVKTENNMEDRRGRGEKTHKSGIGGEDP